MSRLTVAFLALAPLLSTGCVVHSKQPHCSPEEQITDDAVLGEWIPIKDPDVPKEPLTFTGNGDGHRFRVTQEKGRVYEVVDVTAGTHTSAPGRLFKMGGHYFLDVKEDKGHVLYWVAVHGSQVHLRMPCVTPVAETLEKNKTLPYVLTRNRDGQIESLVVDAPPEKLQAFYRPRLYEPGWFVRVGSLETTGAKVPVAGTGLAGKTQRNLE